MLLPFLTLLHFFIAPQLQAIALLRFVLKTKKCKKHCVLLPLKRGPPMLRFFFCKKKPEGDGGGRIKGLKG
jgi:hypothetical protein